MRKWIIVLISFLCILTTELYSQETSQESTEKNNLVRTGFLFPIHFSLQLPAADMAKRFGSNSNIGLAFSYRFSNNMFLTAEGTVLFGNEIKEEGFLQNLLTEEGNVTSRDGLLADVVISERGYYSGLSVGKLFPFKKRNRDFGIQINLGTGFIQHKILIFDRFDSAPQLLGPYKKGYDRLTNGWYLNQFISIVNFDKKNRLNFFAGIEIVEGITKNRRAINFDTKQTEFSNRLDILIGLKAGFILSLLNRDKEEYYFD